MIDETIHEDSGTRRSDRIRARGQRDTDFFVVPLHFHEEGLILEQIKPRNEWCRDNCTGEFAADLDEEGFIMLFTDANDALNFKMRWY